MEERRWLESALYFLQNGDEDPLREVLSLLASSKSGLAIIEENRYLFNEHMSDQEWNDLVNRYVPDPKYKN